MSSDLCLLLFSSEAQMVLMFRKALVDAPKYYLEVKILVKSALAQRGMVPVSTRYDHLRK